MMIRCKSSSFVYQIPKDVKTLFAILLFLTYQTKHKVKVVPLILQLLTQKHFGVFDAHFGVFELAISIVKKIANGPIGLTI